MRAYKTFLVILICIGISLLVPCNAFAQAQKETAFRKKIIQLGWDMPNTATLRKNLRQMEQAPFDGVIIGVDGKDDAGRTVRALDAFSGIPWKAGWFQSSVDDLKAIHSDKLTDNFIRVGANPGNVDWFDDAGWAQIVEHMRIVAWIAKEGNLKGIVFDPESYTKPFQQFEYTSQPLRNAHSFQEYQAKARQRGREMISTVAEIAPNLVFFTLFMNSINADAAKSTYPQSALQLSNYNLYPAFINGWLDAAPSTMAFVDGCEAQGYHANSQLDFLQAADVVRNAALDLVVSENRQKYLAQVQTSFGIYLAAYINPPTAQWYIDPKSSTPTRRLQMNVQYAINASTQYVWVYGEKYRWWPTENPSVNPQSWEDVLPGIHDALRTTTHPQLMRQQIITTLLKNGGLVNLLKNGDFSETRPTTVQPIAPAHWVHWQEAGSQGVFSHDNTLNRNGDQQGAARVAGTSNGSFYQLIDVKPGEFYLVRAWSQQFGNGNRYIQVSWQTAENRWTNIWSNVKFFLAPNARNDQWQLLEGVVKVPNNAAKLVVMLCAQKQLTTQDVVWYDDVQVYQIP